MKKLFHELKRKKQKKVVVSGRVRKESNFFIKLFETYIALVLYIHFLMYNVIRKVLIRVLLLCRTDNGWREMKKTTKRKKARQFCNEKRFVSLSERRNKLDKEKWNKNLHIRREDNKSSSSNIIESEITLRMINQKRTDWSFGTKKTTLAFTVST